MYRTLAESIMLGSPERLEAAQDIAVKAALHVAPRLRENFGKIPATQKDGDMGPVTELDLWAEHEIKNVLSSYDETYGFLGEEHGQEGNQDTYWIIDPIDGTRQFVRGIPFCATMICLANKEDLLVSVIHNFVTNEMFTATKDGGAYLNGERISISSRPLGKSVVDVSVNLDDQRGVNLLTAVAGNVITLARYNCSAYTTTLIASGKIEGRVWVGRKGGPWDHAPGALLITEAGGVVVHADGKEYDPTRVDSVISGTKEVVGMALDLYKNTHEV